jgi:hypothetical protein
MLYQNLSINCITDSGLRNWQVTDDAGSKLCGFNLVYGHDP